MSTSREESLEQADGQGSAAALAPLQAPGQEVAARPLDDIDDMLAGHQSPIKASLADAAPLVSTAADQNNAAPLATKRQPSIRKAPSISPSPKPAASKGLPAQRAQPLAAPIEQVARKPAVPRVNIKRASPPRQHRDDNNAQDPASAAEKMAHLSARERVELGLRQMRSLQEKRPTSSFATVTPRTAFGISPEPERKTAQQVKKEQMIAERIEKVSARIGRSASASPLDSHNNPTRSLKAFQQYERQSSWARDTTERGLYTFNWTALPQTIPKRHVDPSPGPGAYTSPLHFLGGH